MEDYRRKLEKLNPNVTLSVEMPHAGNGDLFQVRTTVSDGLVFYGRASTEDEAILKCCQKAVKHLLKTNNNVAPETHHHSRAPRGPSSKQPRSPARPPRRNRETPRGFSSREEELRHEMGSVLDRVAEWSRYYDHNGNPEQNNNNPRRRSNTSRRGSDREPERPPRRANRRNPATSSAKVRSPSPSVSSTSEATGSTAATAKSPNSLLSEEVLASLKGKTVQLKNAVMMLNEMFPPPRAPQYKVTSQTGPPNNPTFSMVCCIDDQTFQGEGKSKKEAKLACSQQAIEAIVGIKISENRAMPEKSNPRANCDLDDWMELEGKNPVSILNELYPGIQYQLISTSGPSHAPQFVIRASLNDMSFEGSGKSKKDAKLNASKALLVHLHKVGFDPMTGDMMSTQQNNSDVADGHSFADKIGQLVTNKYQALFGTTTYSKRRVMSGIVLSREVEDEDEESFEVICVSSGTKCINGEQLSLEGCVINDSHAEIVSRRCIIYYLYSQLENYATDPEKAILEMAEDGKFRLKDGIGFHLFITTSPCGDARIFSLHESSTSNPEANAAKAKTDTTEESSTATESESKEDQPENPEDAVPTEVVVEEVKDPNINPDEFENYGNDEVAIYVTKAEEPRKREAKPMSDSSRGMLRSKIECGMGTVPLSPKMHLQTWDGVMSGDRLLTMACSDKILRWNVLGIQGALLTHFLHPIYLKSITVGSKFHPGHMKRALYERIANHVGPLPSDHYILNMPQLYATTSPETRQATKAHDYSVNWILDHGQPEIVNGSTGKTINESTSRLSKKALFGRFMKINGELSLPNKRVFNSPIQYSAVKQLATDYQKVKAQVTTALMTAGCGHWIEKPVEQDQFSL